MRAASAVSWCSSFVTRFESALSCAGVTFDAQAAVTSTSAVRAEASRAFMGDPFLERWSWRVRPRQVILSLSVPVNVEKITVSLHRTLAQEIRDHAALEHRGKFSTAIAELATLGLRALDGGEGVTKYALSST